jgi:hypothetical protein
MGLLDDAIREHLDLKRRRGADPGEVERAEREALGPVRRNPSSADLPSAEDTEDAEDDGFAYDQAAEDDWSHDSVHEPAGGAAAEPVYDEPPLRQPGPEEPPADARQARGAVSADPEVGPRRSPTRPPSSRPLTDMGGSETQEYNVEDALSSEEQGAAADDDDVLEETPEFLQDTPDHDRLWFEQRPPKDFDFDE